MSTSINRARFKRNFVLNLFYLVEKIVSKKVERVRVLHKGPYSKTPREMYLKVEGPRSCPKGQSWFPHEGKAGAGRAGVCKINVKRRHM